MKVRDWFKKLDSFSYVVDKMEFCSSLGRYYFMDIEFSCDAEALQKEYSRQDRFARLLTSENSRLIEKLKGYLMEIRDIRGSVSVLAQGGVVSELELFEIKRVAYYSDKISEILCRLGYLDIEIVSLEEVFDILNPQNSELLYFYIYDDYSPALKILREQLKGAEEIEKERLYIEIDSHQVEILSELSKRIGRYSEQLSEAINKFAYIDFMLAATAMYKKYGFTRVTLSSQKTIIRSMFNPMIKDSLEGAGGEYQAIDIDFDMLPTLIYGANMSGKSVILNTVVLCQLLAQFGMFIPSRGAEVSLKEDIFISLSDNSSLDSGLSSFAREILDINEMVKSIERGARPLIVIDEAARTTNPIEGVAIVSAIIDIFTRYGVSALLTTHYSGIKCTCRHLRVKGVLGKEITEKITVNNINKYIDYSLEQTQSQVAPQEAITIAQMLGVSGEFLDSMKKYY